MDQNLPLRRMSDTLTVVGFDPSLRNWGMAKSTYIPSTNLIGGPVLAITQPSVSKTKQTRRNSEDLEKAEQLAAGAIAFAKDAQAVFVEVPVGSQSARAMASYGVCVGILATLRTIGIPFFLITPEEVKLSTGLSGKASKAEMIEWATTKYPNSNWPTEIEHGETRIIQSKAEHMADAVAAIHAGINSQQFKQLLALINR